MSSSLVTSALEQRVLKVFQMGCFVRQEIDAVLSLLLIFLMYIYDVSHFTPAFMICAFNSAVGFEYWMLLF